MGLSVAKRRTYLPDKCRRWLNDSLMLQKYHMKQDKIITANLTDIFMDNNNAIINK